MNVARKIFLIEIQVLDTYTILLHVASYSIKIGERKKFVGFLLYHEKQYSEANSYL